MSKNENLQRVIFMLKRLEEMGYSSYRIHKDTNLSESAISRIKTGFVKRPNAHTLSVIKQYYERVMGVGSSNGFLMKPKVVDETNEFYQNGFQQIMAVPLVDLFEQEEFIKQYAVKEFISGLPKFATVVDKPLKGKHFAFRVSGDSMDDGSSNSIPKNSVVFSRAIEQSMWNKIYLSQYRFFVVVTPSGVMVRKLKEVDDENKTIEFASINPDKNKYADLVLKFSEINMLLNVISSTVFF